MSLRVLFAIGSLEVGGAERQLVRYLKGIDRTRFAPGLWITARRGALLEEVPDDVPIFAFEERLGPGQVYFPGRIHRRQVRDLAAALDEFRADLVVTRAFQQTLVAGGATVRRPTPLVAIEASDPRRDFPRQVRRFGGMKTRLIAKAYRSARAVIALSGGARDGLCSFYGLESESVTVLPNFVDLEEIDRLVAEPGPAFDPAEFHVVCVGRLSIAKGPDVLLEAAGILLRSQRLPNLRLHFIGDGALRSQLEQIADRPPLAGHVAFEGYRRNPFPFLRQADLFCLPSRQEGMPGALLEAMACTVPVVAADCESGPREVLEGGGYGRLVPVGDANALAAAIESISTRPDEARRTAVAARRRVEDEYSAPIGMERLQRLLEWAATSPGRAQDGANRRSGG